MLSLFGFGPLIYVSVLLLNAVAILSEDRFLARIGMGRAHLQQSEPSFGQSAGDPDSLKSRAVNLISSIRMVTRGESAHPLQDGPAVSRARRSAFRRAKAGYLDEVEACSGSATF